MSFAARSLLFLVACAAAAETTEKGAYHVSCFFHHRHTPDAAGGEVVMEVHPSWAPLGAARFRELVEVGFYNDTRIFRSVQDFVAQYGLSGDPHVMQEWRDKKIHDDPFANKSNRKYTVAFASSGQHTRTTQVFINLADNTNLDASFRPFARVVKGIEHVDGINMEYGQQPVQSRIQIRGNKYLDENFPRLTAIKHCIVVD